MTRIDLAGLHANGAGGLSGAANTRVVAASRTAV